MEYHMTPEFAAREAAARREADSPELRDVLGSVRLERVLLAGSTVYCADWGSDQPQLVFDTTTGQCLGTLIPVDREAVAAAPGIQPWSR